MTENPFKEQLQSYKKTTITMDELESLVSNIHTYEDFANQILLLEEENILTMVKASGRNTHTPSLAYKYRINKHLLKKSHYQDLQNHRTKFHNAINLDAYFHKDPAVWQEDLPYLEKINQYIEKHGFPREKEPAPGRSFEIVGDEKWIEQGGAEVLNRIKLWERLLIFPVSDPLMFALNPNQTTNKRQIHLIIENKTTYLALLPALRESPFATLIYGSGNKITKSLEHFPDQYPVEAEHYFYYFGDIDHSGIDIWYRLQQRFPEVIPATAFYQACLLKPKAYGKTNQRKRPDAVQQFVKYFTRENETTIKQLLNEGAYYPQEALNTQELQAIIKQPDWEIPHQ